uniref:RNA polymerase subunit alpha n=1 Tax=Selaginella kraussiana TaxID=81964 RepID=A0A3T0IAT4_9TRAC|nr:RNA polymerase subunit alpha [Selaginella kraussiana]AZU95806.1 RNA polymerase subunit alpha [Selaginella kraussiana]
MGSAAYWRCTEAKADSERLYHSRFIISPSEAGQANTLGAALRRTLLGASGGGYITIIGVFSGTDHEYTAMAGVRESVHDILTNLKDIVLRGRPTALQEAYISVGGPGKVTARDIVLPPFVGIIDPAQHIATLTRNIHFNVRLGVGRREGYRCQNMAERQNGNLLLDAPTVPIRNVNYSIHCYGNHSGGITKEMLLLEIWTNGSLTPGEAIHDTSRNLVNLLSRPLVACIILEADPAARRT